MVSKFHARITYANVVASLALFIALGGSAYAVTQIDPNSVGTKQLKANAVKSGKIADGTVKRVDAVQGAFATPPQLAGKLGIGATAANAAKLGNVPPGGYLRGNGNTVTGEFDVTGETDVLGISEGGRVQVECINSGHGVVFTTTGSDFDLFQHSYADNDAQPNVIHVTRTALDGPLAFSPESQPAIHQIDAKSAGGPALSLTVFIRFRDADDHCIGRYRGFVYPNG